jgi:hypothetical protein
MRIRKRYIFLTIGLVSLSVFLYKCHSDYYAEYNLVKDKLSKIPEVEILSIDGNPDLTLEDIFATIRLKTGDTLLLYSLNKTTFDSTNSIDLGRLNNWEFHITECTSGGHWGGGSIDIGQNSVYAQIKKLNIINIQDVITHIDVIKNVINQIPAHPNFDTLNRKEELVYLQKYDFRKVTNTRELRWANCP